MTAGIRRYLVEPGEGSVEVAFAAAVRLAHEESIDQVTLVMPTKGHIVDSIVGEFLGTARVKLLAKGQSVPLEAGGPNLVLATPKTFSRHSVHGIIVGAHISGKEQKILDDVVDARAIFYLPWTADEGQNWLATWKPTVIGPSTWAAPEGELEPAVEAALEQLTQGINLSTGLNHPMDEAAAIRVIQKLRAEGHTTDAVVMARWAVRRGWSSTAAAKLEKLAKKLRV